MSGYGFLKKVLNAFVQIVLPYKLIGKEKVGQGACVIVGNHYRIWDIVHMACVTKDRVHFIAKQELWKSRFIAYLCKVVGAIPVSRDGTDAKAVMSALRCLKNGEKIAMFPEGTRNKTKDVELLPLKSGAALFAVRAKAPVYPVMCLHKTRLFRRTKIIVGYAVDLSAYYDRRMTSSAGRCLPRGGTISLRRKRQRRQKRRAKKKRGRGRKVNESNRCRKQRLLPRRAARRRNGAKAGGARRLYFRRVGSQSARNGRPFAARDRNGRNRGGGAMRFDAHSAVARCGAVGLRTVRGTRTARS